MIDIYGSHFTFGDKSSREYGLILATEASDRLTAISGSISAVNIFDKKSKKNYLIDDDYSDSPLRQTIVILTDNDQYINASELREIEKWLFNRHSFRKLYIDFDDDCLSQTYELLNGETTQLYLNCRFVNAQRLEYNGGIVGYKTELETDSGYWWQEQTEQSFTINNATDSSVSVITVNVDTDIDDYTYPEVVVTMGEDDGDIIIINNSDSSTRIFRINDVTADTQITIKSGLNYISGDYYGNCVGLNFPRLIDGENHISIQGKLASIKYRFQNRRFL